MYKPSLVFAISVSLLVALVAFSDGQSPDKNSNYGGKPQMQLGNFSVSLAVKDISRSKEFYEKLVFQEVAGELGKN